MEFLILGPLEVRNGANTVRLGAAKQRALLGVLLLHANEAVSTARLVDELWGDQPPATAEKLVQGYVHALRKQLGERRAQMRPPATVSSSTHASTSPSSSGSGRRTQGVTPRAVERVRKALALWRGPALANVELEGPSAHNVGTARGLQLDDADRADRCGARAGPHDEPFGALESWSPSTYQRAPARPADARPLPLREAGGSPRGVPRRAERLDDELGLQPARGVRDLEAGDPAPGRGARGANAAEPEQTTAAGGRGGVHAPAGGCGARVAGVSSSAPRSLCSPSPSLRRWRRRFSSATR